MDDDSKAIAAVSDVFLFILKAGWLESYSPYLTANVADVAKLCGVGEEHIVTIVRFYQHHEVLEISTDGRVIQVALPSYSSTYRTSPARPIVGRGRMLRILEAFNCTCFYCGRIGSISKCPDGKHWHVDHKVALAHGGSNDDDNLALACGSCNTSKGTRTAPKTLAGRVS